MYKITFFEKPIKLVLRLIKQKQFLLIFQTWKTTRLTHILAQNIQFLT